LPEKPLSLGSGVVTFLYVVPGFALFFLTPLLWLLMKSLRAPRGSEWRQWAAPVTIGAGFGMVVGVLLQSAMPLTAGDLPANPAVVTNVASALFIAGSAGVTLMQIVLPMVKAIQAARTRAAPPSRMERGGVAT
jgi:hypothetical protein